MLRLGQPPLPLLVLLLLVLLAVSDAIDVATAKRGRERTGTVTWLEKAGDFTVVKMDRSSRVTMRAHERTVDKFLLHTTEGSTGKHSISGATSTLDSKKYWPHFIVGRNTDNVVTIAQYLPLDKAGRALKNANRRGIIQVEVCGTAKNPFTTSDTEIAEAVKALYQEVHNQIPTIPCSVHSSINFVGSGKVTKNRLKTNDELDEATGLIGHQHVPIDTHWDPGAIDPSVIMCTD